MRPRATSDAVSTTVPTVSRAVFTGSLLEDAVELAAGDGAGVVGVRPTSGVVTGGLGGVASVPEPRERLVLCDTSRRPAGV